MLKKISIIAIMCLIVKFTWATVPATVDRTTLELGQSLTLTITIPDSNQAPNLDALQADFDIYDTSTNSQTSIINSQVSSQTTFVVHLIPKHLGKQIIPTLKVGNDTTATITIEVTQPVAHSDNTHNSDNIYATASLDKYSTYIGVPVVYSVKFYYAVNIDRLGMTPLNIPHTEIKTLGKPLRYQETVNSKIYQVIEQNLLITPQQSGEFSIPAFKIQGSSVATTPSNDFFAMLNSQPFTVMTNVVKLTVKPIPAAINPDNWLPAKELTLSESWNATKYQVGSPIERTITLQGVAIPATTLPNLKFATPVGVNAYPDKVQMQTSINNGTLIGQKTFKIVYIPTSAGTINFPTISLKWWDITTDSLKTATLAATSYTVQANSALGVNNNQANNLISKTTLNSNNIVTSPNSIHSHIWYYIAIVFAILWLITLLGAVILIICRRHKPKPHQPQQLPDTPAMTHKDAIMHIKQACASQNIHALNQALLNWAHLQWHKGIHNLAAVQKLLGAHDQLAVLLAKLDLALYRGSEFTQYSALAEAVSHVKFNSDKSHQNHPEFKEFYPK